jgi:hypothetical protein
LVHSHKRTTKRSKKSKSAKPRATFEVRVIKKVLGKAPEEYAFVLADGRKLQSLHELGSALRDMSDDVFRHHVNEWRNDFSSWVKEVFDEPELADELKSINSKLEAEVVLLRKLVKEMRERK